MKKNIKFCQTRRGHKNPANWKTEKYMGLADTNVLPMKMFAKMEHDSNADRVLSGIFDAEVVSGG